MIYILQFWNLLALDGSNWQRVDLFEFQRDIVVSQNIDLYESSVS